MPSYLSFDKTFEETKFQLGGKLGSERDKIRVWRSLLSHCQRRNYVPVTIACKYYCIKLGINEPVALLPIKSIP